MDQAALYERIPMIAQYVNARFGTQVSAEQALDEMGQGLSPEEDHRMVSNLVDLVSVTPLPVRVKVLLGVLSEFGESGIDLDDIKLWAENPNLVLADVSRSMDALEKLLGWFAN